MKALSMNKIRTTALAIITLSVLMAVQISGQNRQPAFDSVVEGRGARALEGSWTIAVTVRNCQTGDPIRTFLRTATFMQGGTMQEFASAVSPSLRGPGHGVWAHTYENNFTYALQFLRFNADGTFAGSVRERRAIVVAPDGQTFTATGTGEVFDANGNLLFPSCATEAGTRFQ